MAGRTGVCGVQMVTTVICCGAATACWKSPWLRLQAAMSSATDPAVSTGSKRVTSGAVAATCETSVTSWAVTHQLSADSFVREVRLSIVDVDGNTRQPRSVPADNSPGKPSARRLLLLNAWW